MESEFSQFPIFSTQHSQFLSDQATNQPLGEESESKDDKAVRGVGFNKQEDELLVSAWLNTSMDAVVGNEQKSSTFWDRIGKYYNEHKTFESNRTNRMLAQRWQKIQKQVTKFRGCIANLSDKSGQTEQDKIKDAKALYDATAPTKFNLHHAWVLLRHQPKWLLLQDSLDKKTKTKKVSKGKTTNLASSSSASTPIDLEEDNTNNNTHDLLQRPPGRKAEKRKLNETAKNESTPISEHIQKLHEEKKERDERKMELIKKKVEQDEKKLRLKKMEFEMKVMAMDTSSMSEEEKLYYSQLKMKILRGDEL